MFQALKSEVEAGQRPQSPQVAQAIAETERKADEEPDLERRVAIVQAAFKQYPGEPRFEQALQSALELRDLVNSIVSKARFFEDLGQFNDALDQWQILRSIHPSQPGIAAEIQRLTQKRDEASKPAPAQVPPVPAPAFVPAPPPVQSRPPAAPQAPPPAAPRTPGTTKGPWAEQAQQYLDLGDYQRASQAVAIGLAESPTDGELLALDAQVRQGQDSAGRALELLGKAHDEMNRGATEDARASLREAYKLDPRNAVIRTVLLNSLLEEAQRTVNSDPQKAGALVQEVLRMEPAHSQALILARGIEDRKGGPQPLPVPPPVSNVPAGFPPGALPVQPPPAPLREAQTVAVPASVTQALFQQSLPKETPPPAPMAATPPLMPPPVAAAPKPVAPKAPKPPKPPKSGPPKMLLFGTAAAVVLLVAGALGFTLYRNRQKPKPVTPAAPSKFAVVLRTTPEGAEIKISGESCGVSTCNKELAPGNYQAMATLTGYQAASLPIIIAAGGPREFNLILSPQGPKVTVFTDLPDGTAVGLDDAPAGQIQGGSAEVANLTQGKHVLSVKGADSTASVPIEILQGAAPILTGAIDSKNGRCFLVAGFGGDAHVYGSGTGFRATLDGKPLGVLAAAGLPIQGLSPGTHELVFDSDAGQHDRMVFESQPSATLYVSVDTAQNLGTLSVETNPPEDQVHLLINGQKYKRDTARGRLVVYLFPRKYTVTVQKDGFAPALEQTVEVKRGADTKVTFTLSVAKATLAVHHAPPGTDVLVDNISLGKTHPDGEFQVGGIEPGHHIVTLRHDGFRPMQSDQTFAAGKTVDLQATLEAAPTTGTLRFEISPAGIEAHVRIKRDGDAQEHEVTGASVTVQEGRYVVSVSAPQYSPASTSVQVSAGGTAVAAVTLRHVETKAPVKTAPSITFGLADWLKVTGWVQQDGMITHKGGDWVMAPPDIEQGTIHFTVVSIKGRHVEWGVMCRDEKNFVHYELDDKNLTRYEVKDGNKQKPSKIAHGLDKKKPMGIGLIVTPTSVKTSVQLGGWLDLDTWESPSPVHGRFGFRIPGSDEIGLQDFQVIPK